MIRFKPEVRIRYMLGQLGDMLGAAALWSSEHGVDVEIISVDDETPGRSASTVHGMSLAMDVDVVDGDDQAREQLAEFFRKTLPLEFDVAYEGGHVHVEYAVPRGPIKRIAG